MKKLIAIVTIAIVIVGSVFAGTSLNSVDSDSLLITCSLTQTLPTFTLKGSSTSADANDFAHETVAFGPLAANVETITAFFHVDHTESLRWFRTVSVTVDAGTLAADGVSTTAAPTVVEGTMSKTFSGSVAAGTFAAFSVSYNTKDLETGDYEATVTITYTVE